MNGKHVNSMRDMTRTSKVCTTQIACIDSLDSLKIVMLLVFTLTVLPNEFLELLRTSDLKIIRVYVSSDISKIGRDFRCDNFTNNLKHVTNLGRFARKLHVFSNCIALLKTLVKVVLNENMNKNDSIRLSKWSLGSFSV